MPSLIVNADDFGITEGVNRAILSAHEAGGVTSTTLMVNMPSARHAFAMSARAPALAVGWHANLSLGGPVSRPVDVPSLIDASGRLLNRSTLERRLLLGRIDVRDIRRELRAQLDRFLSFGLGPSHVDSHQHFHSFPVVFDALAELAEREGLPVRMPWPWPGTRSTGWRRRFRSLVLGMLLGRRRKHSATRLRTNSGFCSLFDVTDRPDDIDTGLYEGLLRVYSHGIVELMVHPAEVDDDLRRLTRITKFSEREYEWLRTGELVKLAQRLGMRLTNYADECLWQPIGRRNECFKTRL